MKHPALGRAGDGDERDRCPRVPVSTVPGRGSAPGSGAARANEPTAQSPRRSRTAVVCCGRSESPGTRGARLVAQITGLDEKTIRRGQAEVAGSLVDVPVKRQRRSGGG